MADKKESLHDADKKSESLHESHDSVGNDGLHESHDSKHDDGLHGDTEQKHEDGLHSESKAKNAAKKTEKENEEEADAEAEPVDRRSFHHGASVPNDYPGGNPGNADNDRMHQAHAERGGHVKDESDVEFMAKPHHVLPPDAAGLPDDEDVDTIGQAVHGPNDVAPAAHEDDKEDDKK